MPSASITIKGLDTVLRAVQGFPKALEDELTKAIRSALSQTGRTLAQYPPPPPGSTYIRTGDLGRGWTNATPQITAHGSSMTGTLENVVSYDDLVQGDRQAWMHIGRWATATQVLQRLDDDINKMIEGAVDTALKRVGLYGR